MDTLSNITVLDLTTILSGPFCTMLLGDLGARVFKVEKPGSGDESRLWGPPFFNGQSTYFLSVNRNKQSIVVDLKTPDGVEIIKKLISKCDVLVENFIPGKFEKFGFSADLLSKLNPRLVHCSITGFGSSGPYATRAGFDLIISSIGGALALTGPEGGAPCKTGLPYVDTSTGLYAKGAILAALYKRERTGLGSRVEVNLLSSQLSLLSYLGSGYLNCQKMAVRRGTAHESVVPLQSFECSDAKWISVAANSDLAFRKLCSLLFSEDELTVNLMLNDNRFKTNADRVKHRTLLIELLSRQFKLKSVDYWLDKFSGSGLAYGRVNDLDEVFKDEGVQFNNSVIEMVHPVTGSIKVMGPAVSYGGHEGEREGFKCENDQNNNIKPMTAPPLLGEHTKLVLRQFLDYDDNQINAFEQAKVI